MEVRKLGYRVCGDGYSPAALAKLPDWNAEPADLVGEVCLDTGAGKGENAGQQRRQHGVALERRGAAVSGPVRPEGDLGQAAMIDRTGGDALGTLRRSAVQQDHVRMLGMDLIEPIPRSGKRRAARGRCRGRSSWEASSRWIGRAHRGRVHAQFRQTVERLLKDP